MPQNLRVFIFLLSIFFARAGNSSYFLSEAEFWGDVEQRISSLSQLPPTAMPDLTSEGGNGVNPKDICSVSLGIVGDDNVAARVTAAVTPDANKSLISENQYFFLNLFFCSKGNYSLSHFIRFINAQTNIIEILQGLEEQNLIASTASVSQKKFYHLTEFGLKQREAFEKTIYNYYFPDQTNDGDCHQEVAVDQRSPSASIAAIPHKQIYPSDLMDFDNSDILNEFRAEACSSLSIRTRAPEFHWLILSYFSNVSQRLSYDFLRTELVGKHYRVFKECTHSLFDNIMRKLLAAKYLVYKSPETIKRGLRDVGITETGLGLKNLFNQFIESHGYQELMLHIRSHY